MSAENFLKKYKQSGLGAFSKDDLINEINKRETTDNPFPLDVFHPNIKPYLNALNSKYDIPEPFIGLAMLSAYSTAIGTKYTVATNTTDRVYLGVWACMLGMSSSGKSLIIDKVYEPINKIQEDFDYDWAEKTKEMSEDAVKREHMPTVMFRDSHIPTLVRWVLPDNPKGVCKWSDELIEWTGGMDQLSKRDGTDQQFWISSWNGRSYSAVRSGKLKFVLPRPFVNVIGGTQYCMLPKLFSKDRDTTGFIYRLLFARPQRDKMAEVDPHFEMPLEWSNLHERSLKTLYFKLTVESSDEEPFRCVTSKAAIGAYDAWVKGHIKRINAIDDDSDRETQSSILGKIKEYGLRFAAILHLSDKVLSAPFDGEKTDVFFQKEEPITLETMERSIKLAEYFFYSALDVYRAVQTSMIAPAEVLATAVLLKRGMSIKSMAGIMLGKDDAGAKTKMNRNIKKWIREYPRVFGSVAK